MFLHYTASTLLSFKNGCHEGEWGEDGKAMRLWQEETLRYRADVFALKRAHEDELDILREALSERDAALAAHRSAAASLTEARLGDLEAKHASTVGHLRSLLDERGRQLAAAEGSLRATNEAAAAASAAAERSLDAAREELAATRVQAADREMRFAAEADARVAAAERARRVELAAAERAAGEREAALWLRIEALRLGIGDGPSIRLLAPSDSFTQARSTPPNRNLAEKGGAQRDAAGAALPSPESSRSTSAALTHRTLSEGGSSPSGRRHPLKYI